MVEADIALVRLGRITGVYGVRGWVRVSSDTEPASNILDYRPWRVRIGEEWVTHTAVEGRPHGKGLVVKLEGLDDRDAAAALSGADIAVSRSALPNLGERDYYWVDLVGADVVTREGTGLGQVSQVMATGANDVLVVVGERERLIPFLEGQVVLEVDLAANRITVDWDPEF
ncbi:MAG: ribosome maturation factor RimM [Gammaproteobacteria bacterium]|nr:ribosome maturation factor RimM [Gammaproteobacteria bacterium]MDH3413528.1 ribosome maturation factor RimM [Gammaproteobacteria bacterium]